MKKQFAAIFAATAVLGVTTAFAANPFSDVTPDSWAYQAVSQLANAGIVNGYPRLALSKAKTTSLVTKWLKW